MDTNRDSCDHHAEEDYIDMEVSSQSSSTILNNSNSSSSSAKSREFEFQMSKNSLEIDTAPSPADELFYKGNLLPLHLPPRLQMVEKLLHNTPTYDYKPFKESNFSTPLLTATNNTPISNNTPFESCNISPADSCQVSKQLDPEEYFSEYSTEISNSFVDIDQNSKKSWTKKLKLIKQSSLGSKLKASRAYLKSLFNKSACSNETSAAANSRNFTQLPILKPTKKIPFGQIDQKGRIGKQKESFDYDHDEKGRGGHRRSFSGAIKRISMTRTSSSLLISSSSSSSSASTSTDSNGFKEMQFFKRSNSVNSDIENPIQAAIAHCKNSHQQHHQKQQIHSRNKTLSDLSFCSVSASSKVIHHEDQRSALCRG